jgi:hypothetical protein
MGRRSYPHTYDNRNHVVAYGGRFGPGKVHMHTAEPAWFGAQIACSNRPVNGDILSIAESKRTPLTCAKCIKLAARKKPMPSYVVILRVDDKDLVMHRLGHVTDEDGQMVFHTGCGRTIEYAFKSARLKLAQAQALGAKPCQRCFG